MTANLNDPEVQQALERFRALRWIERNTLTRTTKAQNELLRSLPADVLVVVAPIIRTELQENESDQSNPKKQ